MITKRVPTDIIDTVIKDGKPHHKTRAWTGGAYNYLRHCVGVLKKYDEEGFKAYSKIKGNGQIPGTKTEESRAAAYQYAAQRAPENATKRLANHARKYLQAVDTASLMKVFDTDEAKSIEEGNKIALALAGQVAAESYDRLHHSSAGNINWTTEDPDMGDEPDLDDDEYFDEPSQDGVSFSDDEEDEDCAEDDIL